MDHLNQIVHTIAMSMGLAWASGINLYAAMLVLGLLGITGHIVLPSALLPLSHPLAITASGIMYFIEFFADKMPGVDTGWDTLHTFIRIPAGAILAAGAVGDIDPALAVAAGIIGGTLTAGSHALKAGSRVIINASPEPFSNWAASIGEDVAVVAGLWTALQYPFVFVGFLILFILLLIWVLPKIWYVIKTLFQRIADLFRSKKGESA
jgi:hypothetical protein